MLDSNINEDEYKYQAFIVQIPKGCYRLKNKQCRNGYQECLYEGECEKRELFRGATGKMVADSP